MLKPKQLLPQKTLTITDGSKYYSKYDPAEALPETEGTAQLAYAVDASLLPSFSFSPASCKYIVCALIWGQNTTAGSLDVNYRASLGNVSQSTGSVSVGANQYYTLKMSYTPAASVTSADIDFGVWGATGLNIMGKTVLVYPTQIQLESGKILYDLKYENVTKQNPFSVEESTAYQWDEYFYPVDEISLKTYYNTTYSKKVANSDPYCFVYAYNENQHQNVVSNIIHGSAYPDYTGFTYPHSISYRILDIEGKL